MAVLPLPTGVQFIDAVSGTVSVAWQNYLLSISSITGTFAPTDAQYWTSTVNATLTNDRNLGLLTTGYVFITVAAGIATPSSSATIPTSVLTGTVGLANGGTHANLSATGGTSQVLQQGSAGADITVGQLATTDISGLASGVYTPTLTNVTNITASTAFQCQYCRVGTVVTVSGKVDIDPTAATALTQLGISLPIASNFGAAEDCGGTAAAAAVAGYSAGIYGDLTNDRASLDFTTAADAANRTWNFIFSYRVI